MSIPITCPSCSALFRVAQKAEGRKMFCPKCGQAMYVAGSEPVKVAGEIPVGKPFQPPAGSHAPLIVLLVLLVLVGGGIGVYFAFLRPGSNDQLPIDPQQVNLQGNEKTDPDGPARDGQNLGHFPEVGRERERERERERGRDQERERKQRVLHRTVEQLREVKKHLGHEESPEQVKKAHEALEEAIHYVKETRSVGGERRQRLVDRLERLDRLLRHDPIKAKQAIDDALEDLEFAAGH